MVTTRYRGIGNDQLMSILVIVYAFMMPLGSVGLGSYGPAPVHFYSYVFVLPTICE